MRRKPPEPAALRLKSVDEREIVRETRTYRFLTFVMGGGVKVSSDEKTKHVKERDERTPIRVASIRGQLRFWWRACNPSKCKTLEELWEREAEIWGSSTKQSKVTIAVQRQLLRPRDHRVYQYVARTNKETEKTEYRVQIADKQFDLAYGSFSLQPSSEAQGATPRVEPGVLQDYAAQEFSVELTYHPALQRDVQVALWAWETFGGLGARTRRGFGAIEQIDGPTSMTDLRKRLDLLLDHPVIAGVPSLAKARFAFAQTMQPHAVDAWTCCLKTLRRLRQGPDLGRNPPQPGSSSPAGRSRWPEPEQIRKHTEQRSGKHKRLSVQVERFPRAVFGLPIIFHFQGGAKRPDEFGKDPADSELKPANAERMASPLILRPIRDGAAFRACALVLTTTMPESIVLKTKSGTIPVEATLDSAQAAQIEPMKINQTVLRDPLARFLEEIKKQ